MLLPALPRAWSKGSVRGLKAIGDITVDIDWENGRVTYAKLTANQGGRVTLAAIDGITDEMVFEQESPYSVTVNGGSVSVANL